MNAIEVVKTRHRLSSTPCPSRFIIKKVIKNKTVFPYSHKSLEGELLYCIGKTLNPKNQNKNYHAFYAVGKYETQTGFVHDLSLFPRAGVTHTRKFQQRRRKDIAGWSSIYHYLPTIHCVSQKFYESIT
jgi:hypothetical protein